MNLRMTTLRFVTAIVAAVAPAPGVASAGEAAGAPPVIAAVPSTIAFQGFLTDAAGVPLDATMSLDFSIYGVASGGSALWTETQPAVAVSDGVFAVTLGVATPFPAGLFTSPNRFLGIGVNGEAELPRTQLRSTPYALSADRAGAAATVDGQIAISNGTQTILGSLFFADERYFTAFGTSGATRALFGSRNDFGEVVLRSDASADRVILSAGGGSGSLELRSADGFSSNSIELNAGFAPGNSCVRLPGDAISSGEMMNEPGLASANNTNFVTLTSTTPQSVISRSITAPSNGFVIALGQSVARIVHTLGTITSGGVGLSDDGVAFGAAQDLNVILSGNAPSGSYAIPAHVNGVFSIASGETKTIHIVASETTGDIDLEDLSLTLLFVPTSYGAVSSTLMEPGGAPEEAGASRGPQTPGEIDAERAASVAWNQERIDRELAAMRAEAEAREASMRAEAEAREARLRDEIGAMRAELTRATGSR